LAFARLLIDPPDVVIMDEATSAPDEVSEAKIMNFRDTGLTAVTVIGIASRSGIEQYFRSRDHGAARARRTPPWGSTNGARPADVECHCAAHTRVWFSSHVMAVHREAAPRSARSR
jgi:hypothetical protein